MARFWPVALVAVLLAATGAAFVYTESLKLTPSPILGTRVDKVFSPVCDCDTDVAEIFFRLRSGDRLSVEIVAARGRVVRELVREEPTPRGPVTVYWNGRDDADEVVPDGGYRPRVHLERQRRTIELPNTIEVDTVPPETALAFLRPLVFSPDGDGRSDRVVAGYRLSEPASARLYVDGVQRVQKRGRQTEGTIAWFGLVGGEPFAPGSYRVTLGARDPAGNLGPRTPARTVLVRYVALGRDRIEAAVGRRFAVLALTDARRVRWTLGGRSGTARPGTLRLRAPARPGRYTLTVEANGRAARAAVIVRGAP